jgi:serine O-acetyltransferase
MACSCAGSVYSAMRLDADRYVHTSYGGERSTLRKRAVAVLLFPGLPAVLLYRICHQLRYGARSNALSKLAYVPAWLIARWYAIKVGIEIDPNAHIGTGLFLNHFGGVVIGPVTMGDNCNIAQTVTLGRSSRVAEWDLREADDVVDVPSIGNRVWIGPGAVIAGPVVVGDDASIAANSLVTRDVPAAGVAMGVPAQVISMKGSFGQVRYRGRDDDPDRAQALLAARSAQLSDQSAR